ncbi:hypothetical protein DDZ14_17310 [Maritimibacter sp. 55A14]|uniref:YybH family protein n=1 Tax=Maritimibacter sp. 55A14 TaxID=2174844 RepID=UPI000D606CAA|nr:SgcJ/EcaC family oxidoreductase [Maritimibacter sp. 55A14]PWE29346.1 hypothetical protein DDZ14_17310 [Maritimibacter sp. 55A14]
MKLLIVSALGATLLGSQVLADPASEIAAASAKFDEDFNSGDAGRIAANFTEDAISLSPGWQFVRGRDGTERMFTAFLKAGFSDKTSTTEDLEIVTDDTVIEVFWDEVSRKTKSGSIEREYDKNLRVWRKGNDGVWRVHRWSWNRLPQNQ